MAGSRLSLAEREEIAIGLACRESVRQIAARLGRAPSTVSREVRRNLSAPRRYRAFPAHIAATARARRSRPRKLAPGSAVRAEVARLLREHYSPAQIAGRLKRDYPGQPELQVSHETIYQALYVQTRGNLRADLAEKLSLKRKQRIPHGTDRRANSPYKEAFKISQRPAEVQDRAVPGHWEGDLIIGANGTAIGTLVERSTRFTILLHLPGDHTAETVAAAMIREMASLPDHLRRSITWDRGTELADYAKIQTALDTTMYFCDPHSPWQRGTNENTNRLLRFWFEKGTDLSVHTPEDIRLVAAKLNRRPRPTLNLETPANRLNQLLQAA